MFGNHCNKLSFKLIQYNSYHFRFCKSQNFQTSSYWKRLNENRSCDTLFFTNGNVNAVIFDNIVHHKNNPLFKVQSLPNLSYSYIKSIASKDVNYKHVLWDLNTDDFKYKPLESICASPHSYMIMLVKQPFLHIAKHTSPLNILSRNQRYRKPKSINLKLNFLMLMESVENSTRQWF